MALEGKLTGKKLKNAIEDYNYFTPGMNKDIKVKVETEDPDEFDDGTTRHSIGTKVWKVFGGLEYKGTITGYDHKRKWYHVLYDDGDTEDFYHNEVKDHLKPTRSEKFQWKKANHLKSKFTPKEMDYTEHVMTLDVGTVRAIAALKTGLDLSENTIPHEMIQVAINTLTSTTMTPEEEALGYFTRRKTENLKPIH